MGDETYGIPSKEFVCPNCGLVQVHVWPKDYDNLCNRCGASMDPPGPDDAGRAEIMPSPSPN